MISAALPEDSKENGADPDDSPNPDGSETTTDILPGEGGSLAGKDEKKPDSDSLVDKDEKDQDPDSLAGKDDGEQKLIEYYTTSSNAVSETTDETKDKEEKEEKDPYKDLLDIKDYTCNMDLAGGLMMGKFVVVKNNSSDVLDLHADFDFLNKKGRSIAKDKYVDYAIAPGQKGIVLQQSNLKGVEGINYKLTASKSDHLPITECIDWKVEDLKEDGIIIYVLNKSIFDIHDFRVRVLWFDGNNKLETVAFRWNNNTDHIFRSGDSRDLDFQRPSGKETYSVFFHGRVEN